MKGLEFRIGEKEKRKIDGYTTMGLAYLRYFFNMICSFVLNIQ